MIRHKISIEILHDLFAIAVLLAGSVVFADLVGQKLTPTEAKMKLIVLASLEMEAGCLRG